MGAYRFVLAFWVLYSHSVGTVAGLNPGVAAVISFYVISGYVMALLFRRHYATPWRPVKFYADRAARLFPQYLTYLALASILVVVFGARSSSAPHAGVVDFLAAALVLPVGYFMVLPNVLILSPTWSLGLEATFYLVFPFLIIAAPKWRLAAAACSLAVFTLAVVGVLHTDFFGYRLLPGTLFMFLIGAALAGDAKERRAALIASLVIGGSVLCASSLLPDIGARHYNIEVGLGLCIGSAAVFAFQKIPSGPIDRALGDLSYGVFLAHFPLMMLCEKFAWGYWPIVPVTSVICSSLSYQLVERPALAWRRSIRRPFYSASAGDLANDNPLR